MGAFGKPGGGQPVARLGIGGLTPTQMRDQGQTFGSSAGMSPASAAQRGDAGPIAYWSTPQQALTFVAPAARYGPVAGVFSRAVFETPLFDLRPDLRSSSGYEPLGQPVGPGVILGDHLNLFLRVRIEVTELPEDLRFYSLEFGEPVNPGAQNYIANREDITLAVYQGYATGLVTFDTTLRWRVSGPIRYWGAALIIDKIVDGDDPVVVVDGALH